MPAPQDRYFEHQGLQLHYLEWGTFGAPAVVLLHGSSAHAHWWDLFAGALADDFHLLAPDLRGHGDSAHSAAVDYSLETYAGDVAALLRHLAVARARIVGHSLGAHVAAVLAASSPVPVDALVLVDLRITGKRAGERPFLDRLRQFSHPVYATREEAVRRFRLLPTGNHAAAEVLAQMAVHGLRETGDGRLTLKFDRETLRDAIPRGVADEITTLRCPILYVRGADSTVATAASAAELRSLVPSALLAEIPAAHHHVMLDNPDAFLKEVAGFLRIEC